MKIIKEIWYILSIAIGLHVNLNAQWTNPSSLNGVVKSFLKLDSLTILAGTNNGDIFISRNLGANWDKVSNNIPSRNIFCFRSFGNKVFAGTDCGCFISTDKGANWSKDNWVLKGKPIRCLIKIEKNILAGTKGGIFISNNHAESWSKINLNINDSISITSFALNDTNILAATNGAGILISSKGSNNWTNIRGISDRVIKSLLAYKNFIFAATNSGIVKSSDYGKSWKLLHDKFMGVNALFYFDSTLYACNYLFQLSYSKNNAISWKKIDILYKGGCVFESASVYSFIKIDSILLAGIDKGLYRSIDNGKSWSAVGFTDAYGGTFALIDSDIVAGTWNDGILISSDRGETWKKSNKGLSRTYVLTLTVKDTIIFAGTYLGGIFRSLDKGGNWQEINVGLKCNHIEKIIVKDNYIFAGTNCDGIYRSGDSGDNWTAVNVGLDGNAKCVKSMIEIHSKLIIGTSDGIYVSSDNGEKWTRSDLMSTVYDFARIGNKVFAGIPGHGVYLSEDDGKNWESVNEGLSNLGIWCLYSDNKNLFAGTAKGIFMSSDKGENWTEISTGLPDEFIYAVGSDDRYLYSGTFGMGIWRRPLSELFNNK